MKFELKVYVRLTLILGFISLAGCSEPSKWSRIPLSGTATLDGQPFNGSVNFRPTSGLQGPSAYGRVVDGKFEFDKESGPVAGKHFVQLVPKADPNNRDQANVGQRVEVPAEKPFELALDFTTPEPEPVPPVRIPTGVDEGIKK